MRLYAGGASGGGDTDVSFLKLIRLLQRLLPCPQSLGSDLGVARVQATDGPPKIVENGLTRGHDPARSHHGRKTCEAPGRYPGFDYIGY